METTNLSADGQKRTVETLSCSAGLTAGSHSHLKFLSVLNSFLSMTAILGNILILIALHRESSLHPPSKLLLRSLATSDLFAGLFPELLAITYWMSVVNEHWNICRYAVVAYHITGYILCGVSLFTLTTISVDRLLALLLGLRYRQVVTLKRTWVIVIALWVVSTAFSATLVWTYFLITIGFAFIAMLLCLVTAILSYTKIFITLRHQQAQLHDHAQQPNQANQLNISRYKKAVSSAIWLQLTLVACYLPYCIVVGLWTYKGLSPTIFISLCYTNTLVLLNSSLNPILYCWKLEEVRQEVKNTIRQVLCHCFSS